MEFSLPSTGCMKGIYYIMIPWVAQRRRMLEEIDTQDYRKVVSTAKGLKAAARLLMETELLGQFSLARTLLYGEV